MTVSRESEIPMAVAPPCHGGAAESSVPAMTRVGALIEPRTGRRSIPAIASPQPAYPPGSVPCSMSMTKETAAGWRALQSWVNQRGGIISLIAAMPPDRPRAARAREEVRGEPARREQRAERRQATRAHQRGPVEPGRPGGQRGERGAADHQG